MSSPLQLRRAIPAAAALALALAAVPATALASPVNLGSAAPFAVLGGSSVSNTGPSVLNGDLGVSPGTSLTGFGAPNAVVNGATHNSDAVAAQAQSDLTTAYNVAAGQPVAPADDRTGQNLGGQVMLAGAYRYASSAQLTGTVTLDGQNVPGAQFVFEIGTTLTTASTSRVAFVRGASPCNVYWQVGSSATLGTGTRFAGNLMANQDISLTSGATVQGRLLAKRGITLINNAIDRSVCSGSTPTPSADTPGSNPSTGADGEPAAGDGTAILRRILPPRTTDRRVCSSGFSAAVRGRHIRRVNFSLDGRRIVSRRRSPFRVFVRATPGAHMVSARVTFRDGTRAKTLRMRYRACAAAVLRPRLGPSQFTG
jgi:hypothetical protein